MLTITKEFSFHAAHRLHLRDRSDAANVTIYDDCARRPIRESIFTDRAAKRPKVQSL